MIDIRKKYQELFANVTVDAKKNAEEATANLQQRRTEECDCRKQLKDLKDTADTSHRSFFDLVRTFTMLAVKRNPDPETVAKAMEPAQTYIAAAAQIPSAKEDLENAEVALETAMDDVAASVEMLEKLTYFTS